MPEVADALHLTAYSNAIGERIVRTIRSECPDHIIAINERHLQAVLAEFAEYYNRDRPHRSLALQSPVSAAVQYTVRVRPVLGGVGRQKSVPFR